MADPVRLPRVWPFVGRANELAHFARSLAADDVHGVVVTGAAGAGKTRLALEFAAIAEASGYGVRRASATRSSERLPFGVIASLLPDKVIEGSPSLGGQAGFLRRASAALLEDSEHDRLVLIIDDAHMLDDYSAVLLHQIANDGAAFVVVTVRAGEPTPDDVVALWKDGLAPRIDLHNLTADELSDVVAGALGGPLDRGTARQLAERSQGNVLFLRELVNGALLDGSLVGEGGLWRLTAPLSPSERLIDLIEMRLADLAADQREALELVAIGEPLRLGELEALTEPQLASDLEAAGLILITQESSSPEARLAHPIYGDVLRARMPRLRLRLISRSLAEVIEQQAPLSENDLLRVAMRRLDGGGGQPALMLEAANTARWRYDFVAAQQLAEAAHQAGAGFPARLLLAQLDALSGRVASAERGLEVLADDATDDRDRTAVALARLDYLGFHQGRIHDGLAIALESERRLADARLRDEVMARRAALTVGVEGPASAVVLAEALVERASGSALIWACIPAAFSLARLGRFDRALEVADLGEASRSQLERPIDWYPWNHRFDTGETLLHMGRLQEAREAATTQYDLAISAGSLEGQAQFGWQIGKIDIERGQLGNAVERCHESIALFHALGRTRYEEFVLQTLALAHALAGEVDAAIAALDRLEALGLEPTHYTGADLLEARGWCAASSGDIGAAASHFSEAVELGWRIGDHVGGAKAAHALARIGRPKEALEDLARFASVIEGPMVGFRLRHVEALLGSDAEQLMQVSEAFEAQGSLVLAAEAAADASVAYLRAGDPRHSSGAVNRSGHLLDQCDPCRTPALCALSARSQLTRAEREVALLAKSGRSNKDIAEELFISVRTVENQLHRVYQKLGINGRKELQGAWEQ